MRRGGSPTGRRALLVPLALGAFGIGLGRTLAAIAAYLLHEGWEVTVLTRRPVDPEAVDRRYGLSVAGLGQWTPPGVSASESRRGRAWRALREHLAFIRRSRRYDLVWMQSPYIPMISLARRSILFTEFPFDREPRARAWRSRLRAYDEVVANSEFTRGWIERYWGVRAGVFYPSVQVSAPATKEPIILAVGRFTGATRSKNQLQLVNAFRRLVDGGLDGWWLDLVGLVDDPAYLAAVRTAAEGLPVRFHLDVSREDLERFYGRAAIFWHGAGMGIDPELEPHRLEHFGIVVAEAMTAACVPVVYAQGGPREIVSDGSTGFLWTQEDELIDRTRSLVERREVRERLAERAASSARARFGPSSFDQRLRSLIEPREER